MHKNTGNFDSKYTIAGRNDQLKVNMSYKVTWASFQEHITLQAPQLEDLYINMHRKLTDLIAS